jgi:hypothetical protein
MKMHIPGMIRDTGLFAGGAVHGKGGGSQPTSSTVTQTNLPAYARPFYERLMNRTEGESKREFEAYPGQRTAGASPDSEMAYGAARNLQNTYLPSFNQASQSYTDALGQANRAVSNYDPNVETWTNANRDQYMNPYISDVVNQAQKSAQQNFAESQAGRNQKAIQSGAFGGSRGAIADEMARREYDSQFQSMTSKLLAQGYDNAQAQFIADRSAKDNAQQFAAKLGMEGAGFGLQAGQAMQGLGEKAFDMGGKQANLLNTYGKEQQATRQQRMNDDYENFINDRDQERNNLIFYSNILHGQGANPQSSVVQYSPSGTSTNQLLGLGLGAVNAFKGS